uniref:Uncharacterized protein n=1 Tax=Clytia hemisphaerica TaxID=252671 RepID=A0A7M5XJE7_9CNID
MYSIFRLFIIAEFINVIENSFYKASNANGASHCTKKFTLEKTSPIQCTLHCGKNKCMNALYQDGRCSCVDDSCRPLPGEYKDNKNEDVIYKSELTPLTPTPICYTPKNSGFATFNLPFTGKIKYLKLVHVSGGTVCSVNHLYSKWGCTFGNYQVNDIHVVTTNELNQIIFPTVTHAGTVVRMEGADRDADELIQRPDSPVGVSANQKFRIWYTEDLYDLSESNNYGTHCIRVYAEYC